MKIKKAMSGVIRRLVFLAGKILMPLMVFMSCSVYAEASGLPEPGEVMESYRNNPYIRLYEGNQGIAWTCVHPGGCALSSHGTYIYTGTQSIYRGAEGTEVFPTDVTGRRNPEEVLPEGHHYYAERITNDVIPIEKWVLTHRNAKCIHGPFEACRDYEYYGVSGLSNEKCGAEYDSGWIGYCADCGEPVTGLVYAYDDCVRRIGYIFAGSGDYAKDYPCVHLFFCPADGDNLENQFAVPSHFCRSFISCNRYRVSFDGNGALMGSMEELVCYYGGGTVYEGTEVEAPPKITSNAYIRPGYRFAGWSDSPDGSVIFEECEDVAFLEEHFAELHGTGDEANDITVTLYAVWEECDSFFRISGGYFGGHEGSYNGVPAGTYEDGINEFYKGHMFETVADISLLDHPAGYRVSFVTGEGSGISPIFADTELTGWEVSSDDPYADAFELKNGDMFVNGYVGGNISGLSPNGDLTYIHLSNTPDSADLITALWRSTTLELPGAVSQGYAFQGWYSSPDLLPEHFVGNRGDLFKPECDTVLYASFSLLDLEAHPDYMGNDTFGDLRYNGLTRLAVSGGGMCDVFRYYISPLKDDPEWTEAATDQAGVSEGGAVLRYGEGGTYSETVVRKTGIYTLELWGGKGASYGEYFGDNGEYSSCRVFLHEGDVLGIYTGREGNIENVSEGIVCHGGEGSYITVNGMRFMTCSGGKGADCVVNVNRSFSYTGGMQSYSVEAEGDYRLEVWGAQGNYNSDRENAGGTGGYSAGTVHLYAGETIYICVGGQNGFNGGGSGGSDGWGGGGGNGGGATHMASRSGQLSGLSGYRESIYLVAGGGGGGIEGGTGASTWPGATCYATGGTQTRPGSCNGGHSGGFGYGGSGRPSNISRGDSPFIQNGGGGGGWYGGGGGNIANDSYGCGGGGGSGYIGGVINGTTYGGANGGNGRARITCSINIRGEAPSGEATSFSPGNILYADHTSASSELSVYPEGVSEGSGYCRITEPSVIFYDTSSKLVSSPDTEPPHDLNGIGIDYDPVTGKAKLYWMLPDDGGTGYLYMARSYYAEDLIAGRDIYASTDTESLCIKTGTYRYRYCIDTEEERSAEYVLDHGIMLPTPWAAFSGTAPDMDYAAWYGSVSAAEKLCREIEYTPDGSGRYLHIISEDRAGNISGVYNIAIDGKGAFIPYPVRTEKLELISGEHVWQAEDREGTYYVKADGRSCFTLRYGAYVDGYARNGYQVERCSVNMNGSDRVNVFYERGEVSLQESEVLCAGTERSPVFYLSPGDETSALRSGYGKRIVFSREFTTLHEGSMFFYPGAEAFLEEDAYLLPDSERSMKSDVMEDVSNGITIIGDATPPVCEVSVCGGDHIPLEGSDISNTVIRSLIDRRGHDVTIDLHVYDEGAGTCGGFSVRIFNTDNGLEKVISCDGDHCLLELKVDRNSEEPEFTDKLFNGDFTIYVSAEDRVGNSGTVSSERITEVDIDARIVRNLDEISGSLTDDDGNVYMKRGESGYVSSEILGYPDAVLVDFTNDELDAYDTLYIFGEFDAGTFTGNVVNMTGGEHRIQLRTDFTIPLEYEGGSVHAVITAYKDGRSISWECDAEVLAEGSVLDEFMTILKGPGH